MTKFLPVAILAFLATVLFGGPIYRTVAQGITNAVTVTNTNPNGSAVSANSAPVVIASDQAAVATKAAASAFVAGSIADLAHGQGTMAASVPVAIASNQSAVPASQSGTWNITNVSGTLSLPTGAATSANQPTNAAQGSTTSGQTGTMAMGAVTTGAPTVSNGQTSPLSIDSTGNLRTAIESSTQLTISRPGFGGSFPLVGEAFGGDALSSEPSAATSGSFTGAMFDLTGKTVTSPYANRENMVRGAASTTGTGATTLIAAQGAGIKTYITDVECGRTDAGTSAIIVTFGDAASTVLVLPNAGGGGANSKTFNVPLVTAANTAFTFTAGTGTTTVYCNAQGFIGY